MPPFGEISGCGLLLSSLKDSVFATEVGHWRSTSSSTWVGLKFLSGEYCHQLAMQFPGLQFTLQMKIGHSVYPRKKDFLDAVSRKRWCPSVLKWSEFFTSDYYTHYGIKEKVTNRTKCVRMKIDTVKRKPKFRAVNYWSWEIQTTNWNPISVFCRKILMELQAW